MFCMCTLLPLGLASHGRSGLCQTSCHYYWYDIYIHMEVLSSFVKLMWCLNTSCHISGSSSTCCIHYTQPPATIAASTASSSHAVQDPARSASRHTNIRTVHGDASRWDHHRLMVRGRRVLPLSPAEGAPEGPRARTKVEAKNDQEGSAQA